MSARRRVVVPLLGFSLGLLAVLSGEVPTAVGQPKPVPVTPAPQAPTLTSPANLGGKPGTTVDLRLTGTNLADATAVLLTVPGATVELSADPKGNDAARLRGTVALPANTPIGLYALRAATKAGVSNVRPFVVDDLPAVTPADVTKKDAAPVIPVPSVVLGRLDAEGSNFFKLPVAAGQTLTFEVLARRIGSPLDPIVVLHDAKTRRELVSLYADDTPGLQADCRLTHTFKAAGEVIAEVRDTTYKGGPDHFYRLRVGDFPGATTAFPLAVQRGQTAKVGFTGPGAEGVPAVSVTAPKDAWAAAVYAVPKRAGGASGWPVPVRVSDWPEAVEQEPNNEPAKANKLPVPGGVSAKFGAPGDVDYFAFAAKKGQKLAVEALTYQVNAPTEVLLRVLDAAGKEVGKSNPANPGAKVEFTPAADGEYKVACEHLNYLFGPNEVYHLSVAPAAPDVALTVPLDRCEAPPGGGTAVVVTAVTRLNGFAGPIELSVDGHPALSGTATVAPGQASAAVPVLVKAGTKSGAYPFRLKATFTADGKEVVRYAALTDAVKASLGNMPNPPADLLGGLAAGVTDGAPFALTLTADPAKVEKGKAAKVVVAATRAGKFDAEIAVTPLLSPANVTVAGKPVAKGMSKGEATATVAAAATAGPTAVVLRGTAKAGGKDYAVTAAPVVLEVVEPAKGAPPKKEPPKKSKK